MSAESSPAGNAAPKGPVGSVYGLSRTALRQVLQPPGVSTLQLAQLLWQGLGGDASLCQTICSQPPRLNSRTQ